MTIDPNSGANALPAGPTQHFDELPGAHTALPSTSPAQSTAQSPSTSDKAAQVASSAKDSAKDVASTAKGQAAGTAEVAGEELRTVAAEAADQAKDLLAELRSQVSEQAGTAQQRLTEMLRAFTDELQQMTDRSEQSGPATQLVRQVAEKAEALHDQLDRNDAAQLLGQGRGVARRRPGAFLLGALAAGVVAGRLTRGAKTETAATGTAAVTDPTPYSGDLATPPGQASIDLTTPAAGYGEPVFEPSPYERASLDRPGAIGGTP